MPVDLIGEQDLMVHQDPYVAGQVSLMISQAILGVGDGRDVVIQNLEILVNLSLRDLKISDVLPLKLDIFGKFRF